MNLQPARPQLVKILAKKEKLERMREKTKNSWLKEKEEDEIREREITNE